jgi:hypothetical protein
MVCDSPYWSVTVSVHDPGPTAVTVKGVDDAVVDGVAG